MSEINKESVKNHSIENLQTLLAGCEETITESKGQKPQTAGFWKAVENKFIIRREIDARSKKAA